MATEVRLPQFGMGMQEGKLLRWFKHEGEPVEEGEPLCEVETEKATVEVPSPQSGLLTRIMVEVDRTVPVLEVLALIESAHDRLSSAPPHPPDALAQAAAAGPARQSHASSGQAGVSVPATSVAGAATLGDMASRGVQVTPLARRVAKDLGIDLNEVRGTGPGGRITDTDVRRTVASRRQSRVDEFPSPVSGPKVIHEQPATQVEPRARRLAIQHGIELSAVAGSGPGGRITEVDVQRMVNARQRREPEPPPLPSSVLKNDGGEAQESPPQVIRLTGMRGVIARRMLESIQTSAQLTLMSEADVSALVKRRESLAKQFDITYTDLLIKAAALALRKHPRLNATVTSQEIRVLPDIHIGMAVALDEGLVVPVVRNADRKPLRTIAGETAEFIQRARGGKLMMAEITGGTFTVTNLGSFGIDAFTPILNPPEAAILGVGRIVERLARRDSDLLWRHMMALSLTIDHRVVDGAPAAAFLQTLRELLERPELLA
jgi:pyruvate dehydrogenase E2 component (dihydrolipoamide acetyltransferase)